MLLLTLAASALQGDSRARAAEPNDDRRIKAAFVVNFLSFTEWPRSKLAAPPAPLVVAVINDKEFAALIAGLLAGRTVAGRTVVIKVVSGAEAARDAHAVFIPTSEARALPAILRELSTSPVLTIGDTDGFARDGVALNLYTLDRRIRIEANSTAAARAGLRLSANLMRLARIVE
jgi:hypothetical protein